MGHLNLFLLRQKKLPALFVLLVLMTSSFFAAGCAHDEEVVEKERVVQSDPVTGTSQTTTTYTERETLDEEEGSVVGSVFNAIGEVIALPFRLVAGLFRAIF